MSAAALDRRRLLIGLGALVVSAPAWAAAPVAGAPVPAGKPPLTPDELDSWIAVAPDGTVTAFFGKPDVGLGVDVAVAQIVAEELDVALASVSIMGGDTDLTCNQGGVSGSTGVQRGGAMLRNAAAEARRLLLEAAAEKLAVPVEQLAVEAGVVSVVGQPKRKVSYGRLVKGGFFRTKLDWNGQLGNTLSATGKAKPKRPDQYRLVGQSPPRRDIPGKVFGGADYVFDRKLPGMVHARVIRPAKAGAAPLAVDEASLAGLAGARVVRKGDFIAVVADREWDAIQAARRLKVTWSEVPAPFATQATLYETIRATEPAKRQTDRTEGDLPAAFARAARVVEAEYEWPFQSHASMAPACALADVRPDGVTVWHSSQKPHAARESIAKLLGRRPDEVRSISVAGPGSYGRNDAGDAAGDAAMISSLVGRPVRLQGQRADGTAWDPKGAASVHKVRGALDAEGRLIGYDYLSKGFTRMEVATAEANPHDLLVGQLTGHANPVTYGFGQPEEAYRIEARRMGWEAIPSWLPRASPLRTSHLRDPLGPQLHFASECFMDECALAAGADPVDFRRRMLADPRHIAVIEAAAEKAGWKPGPPGARARTRGSTLIGQGIAYCARSGTMVAVVAEVEVEPASGRVWPRRFTVAHDCGLIVNRRGLELCIEGNIVQAVSRTLCEEVAFNTETVTSVDWATYPILDIMDAPEAIDIVLLDRPELPAGGAGEPATRPTAAAIANAVFDATGKRIRRAPFTRARVKAALA